MAIARLLPLLAITLLVASCASTATWRISTKDGRQFLCEGQPQFQKKTGYYRYRNFQGRDALIRADEVVQIEQDL